MAASSSALERAHAVEGKEVLKFLGVSEERGLTRSQVEAHRAKYGVNELQTEEGKGVLAMILEQFEDLLVRILLGAACVSFGLAYLEGGHGESVVMAYMEPLVIVVILVLNAVVGVWQESSAEAALEALKKLQSEKAKVVRQPETTATGATASGSGSFEEIEASELVVGDIVHVRVGDKVPADLRILKLLTSCLKVEQSQLTGESEGVLKTAAAAGAGAAGSGSGSGSSVQDKKNMLFSSTTVSMGGCVGVVVKVGMSTEIGKIQSAVSAAASEENSTPLQKKIDEFGELLAKIIFVICAVVWVINYKHFFDPVHGGALRGCVYYFKIAVALAVAAIPEGLPAVITTCLALGSRRMAQNHCIVRKLPSVETLGCTTVICSDKTGTLTTNEMCVVRLALPVTAAVGGAAGGVAMQEHEVEGTSYAPVGRVQGRAAKGGVGKGEIGLQWLCKVATICNDSRIVGERAATGQLQYKRLGEPTEAALRVLVEKLSGASEGGSEGDLPSMRQWSRDLEKVAVLEFARERKSMGVVVKETSGASGKVGGAGLRVLVKGAPESVLERCTGVMTGSGEVKTLTEAMRTKILKETVGSMAKEALRTLALAVRLEGVTEKEVEENSRDARNFVKIEKDLVLVGIVGIRDPPRPECQAAIEACRRAGIAVFMITGDNKNTAEAVATELGILAKAGTSDAAGSSSSFTGEEFDKLSEAMKREVLTAATVRGGMVFSRTEPRHKQEIVKILKELDEVVAMTGDGVNDAPALRQADIGIAMGLSGTEVAKEASAMILTDDNFSTIVQAVEEGRSIYNNMKAFIRYLISSNIGEVASIFFTAALGIPEGLAPVQLLWVNLVTDGLPATALSFNPPDLNVMDKPPRSKDDKLITGWVLFRYMVIGIYVGFATVGIMVYWYVYDAQAPDAHTLVTLDQLTHWNQCSTWTNFQAAPVAGMTAGDACSYFTGGKLKASTLSLTVLVIIEMLNAMNALSEDGSLLQIPPWANPLLILAACGSILVHFCILYIPVFNGIFQVVPLTGHDWTLVMAFSVPVIFVDEILKFYARNRLAVTSGSRTHNYKQL